MGNKFLITFLSLLLPLAIQASVYYVAPAGDDANPGTSLAEPWKTIQKATDTVNPGDTVLLAGGVYKEKVTFTRSGTAVQKIVFKNQPDQKPVIDGEGIALLKWGGLVTFENVGYLQVEGLEMRNSTSVVLRIVGESHHLDLAGLDVHHGKNNGIYIEGPHERPAFSVFRGCKVHHNNYGGLAIWHAKGGYYLIENNEVYANAGTNNYDGLQVGSGDGATHHIVVRNNRIFDHGTPTDFDYLDLGGHALVHHYLVEGNEVYSNDGLGLFKLHNGDLKGVGAPGASYVPGTSCYSIARFNRFTGVGFVSYEYPNPLALYHNTFVDGGNNHTILFWGEDTSTDQSFGDSTYAGGDDGRMNIKNNIFFQQKPCEKTVILATGPTPATIDLTRKSVFLQYNLYKFVTGQKIGMNEEQYFSPLDAAAFARYQAAHSPDNNQDVGSLLTTVEPAAMFADYAKRNYQLVAGSPAIDKGTPLTKATNAGTNSKTLTVDRASYFQDGYCVGEESLCAPDSIMIGTNPRVAIVKGGVNDKANTITLAEPATWKAGDPVTLPFSGSAPDIGAIERFSGLVIDVK